MKLKLEIAKLQEKYGGSMVSDVVDEISGEMRGGRFHDVLGCRDCWIDPHNGDICYCPQSIYNPHHFAHHCPDSSCACQIDPFVLT